MVTFGPLADLLTGRGVTSAGILEGREEAREAVSSGCGPLDGLLPGGGVRRGSLVEWLGGAAADGIAGGGALSLALAVGCRVARADRGGAIVVVDRGGWFHPPAVLPWLEATGGTDRLVVARPAHADDEIWAIDQALRCAGVAAVVAWPRLTLPKDVARTAAGGRRGPQAWSTAMRRWQLAARSSGAVGLLVRPEEAVPEPSWAESRIAVVPLAGGAPRERRLRLERVGGTWSAARAHGGGAVEVVLDLGCGAVRPGGAARRVREEGGASCRAS